MQPFATSVRASLSSTSFCVALGKAKSHLTPHGRWLARYLASLEMVGVFANPAAAVVFQVHDPGQLFGVDARRIDDRAVRIGKRDRLRAVLNQFFDRVLGDIARTGDRRPLCRASPSPRVASISSAK